MRRFVLLVAISLAVSGPVFGRTLSLEDRVAARTALERVYWEHRIWPSDNPSPKPPLEAVLSPDAIRSKVEDDLRKSNALDRHWGRPITGELLQQEIDRMARDTRDPEMLRDLFAALKNDPLLIAECLARPILADRLTRIWWASDIETLPGEKTPAAFEAWWTETAPSISTDLAVPESDDPSLPAITAGCTDGTWVPTAVDGPDRRFGHTAVWTGSEMIVWGGEYAGVNDGSDVGFRYSPATDTWTVMSASGAATPRKLFTAVWTGTVMVVWGGYGPGRLDTGGRYNPSTDTWTPTTTSGAPTPRGLHTAVWTGSLMIVWGGDQLSGSMSGGRYNPVTDSWTPTNEIGPNVPFSRDSHTAVWTGTEMILWGGGQTQTGARYNPTTDSWTPTSLGANVPSGRKNHTAVWTGTEMIIWGGESQAGLENTGARYRPSNDTWSTVSTGANVPSPRHFLSAVWTGTQMIVWGGRITLGGGVQSYTNTGGRYTPSSDTWTPVGTGAGVPVSRQQHSAVWTGTQMIVWGGRGTTTWDTGGRYTPSTDSWTPTRVRTIPPTGGGPAVWTGAEMFVPGGLYDPALDTWRAPSAGPPFVTVGLWTGIEILGVSAAYNPLSDTWRNTSAAGRPTQGGPTLVWTGTRMLAYGGIENGIPKGDCTEYDPQADVWTPRPAFSNRFDHTAVWTGTEMIVWGGRTFGFATLNTGARFNPTTGTWAATSVTNGPSARFQHTATWTGTQMIIWGGSNDSSGGRYDPATDLWTPTSVGANVPSPRSNATAIWTGTQLIVWGGGGSLGVRNDGARYDPASNTWTPVGAVGKLPASRQQHAAVRTNEEMIVWSGSPLTFTGGRYCALPCTATVWYRDQDTDGYGTELNTQSSCTKPAGYVPTRGDCLDTNSAVHPGATEQCNGADDDCSGTVPASEVDADGDTYVACGGDCNDGNPAIHPGATEVCNTFDDDCNGFPDDGPAGWDPDLDGIATACDVCPLTWDPPQSDTDHDGQGDWCDADDGVRTTFFTSKTRLVWDLEDSPSSWNFYLGDLEVLRSTGTYTQAPGSNPLADRVCGLTSAFLDIAAVPSPGAVAYSLVTGVSGGVEGSLGPDSSGTTRPNANPCP